MTPSQKKALQDYEDSVNGFVNGGQQQYQSTGNLTTEDLGPSQMAGIQSDPKYKQAELAALRGLEDQAQNGFTARDRADMSRVQSQISQGHRGRMGAIQQNMQARGIGGGGMELAASLQSAQDANEIAAMRGLEQEATMQERKSAATRDLGSMSSSLQQRDFGQAAQQAQSADQIARFNKQNRNDATRYNVGNAQQLSNMNVGGANAFGQSSMNAQTGLATVNYNAATEEENRRLLAEEDRKKKAAAKRAATGQAIGSVVGGVAGTFLMPGVGTAAGASMGSSLGGAAANYAHGGVVPGHAKFPGDDERNDTVPARLSPGEVVLPRSATDAVGDLLQALAHLTKGHK